MVCSWVGISSLSLGELSVLVISVTHVNEWFLLGAFHPPSKAEFFIPHHTPNSAFFSLPLYSVKILIGVSRCFWKTLQRFLPLLQQHQPLQQMDLPHKSLQSLGL